MRVAVQVSGDGPSWSSTVDYVREAEHIGVEMCWVAEAWGADAVSALGYLSAVTDRIQLGSAILQLSSRSATMAARTALALSTISGGRFVLGLGVSGPQVVEGLDGTAFDHPLGRMRDTVEVVRRAARGERIAYEGRHITLPRPGGDGKALRLAVQPNPELKIYLAALSPKMLELTGEVADGWLGTSFVADRKDHYLDRLTIGAARADRGIEALDLCQGGDVAFADNDEELQALVDARRVGLAFSLGGMGTPDRNFYNAAYAAQGWSDVAAEVQRLWVSGKRDAATAAVPDEMILSTTLLGTVAMVRERLRVWRDAGITTLRVYPDGASLDHRIATLARVVELVRELNATPRSRADDVAV